MHFGSFHLLDILVVLGYVVLVVWMGRRLKVFSQTEEGFFLAGRRLGKFFQFFLNFGNATEPQNAVSTASFVYQQGAPGAWLSFQTVFTNPYFWFMTTWFRRVRLTTVSDLFEERFDSRGLSLFYALYQILVTCVVLGFGNITAYKVASSLAVKNETNWTSKERAAIGEHRDLNRLEAIHAKTTLEGKDLARLVWLRDKSVRGELTSYVTMLDELAFYICFAAVIGTYIIVGGLAAAAFKDVMQSIFMVLFSVLLIPSGLSVIGGWGALAEKVPRDMFRLFGTPETNQFTVWSLIGILLLSVVQNSGLSHNMAIYGSAKDESSARWGVAGTYLKRVLIIMWAFTGLIAVAFFRSGELSDPDAVWGVMAHRLLGPGLVGLMFVGVLAGTMSMLAAKIVALSSLLVRNCYRRFVPDLSEQRGLVLARWSIVGILILGVVFAFQLGNFYDVVKILMTVNVPFGAAIMLMFWWRRVTKVAVWCSVILTIIVTVIVPWTGSKFSQLAHDKNLTKMSSVPGTGIYFSKVVYSDPSDSASPLIAAPLRTNPFNFEAWIVGRAGVDVESLSPSERFAIQCLFDALFPFVVLVTISLVTKPSDKGRVDFFYGKMKTPIGATLALDEEAIEQTRRSPGRFDYTKMLPRSNWEFCWWTREDVIGFSAYCALSAGIVGLFVLLLAFASK